MRLILCGAGSVIIVLVCSSVCLVEGASFRGLGFLPGANMSAATGVSAYGNAVVGWGIRCSEMEGFIWTEANGMVNLGGLPNESGPCPMSEVYSVSCDGSFVVGDSVIGEYYGYCVACRWSGPNDILTLDPQWGCATKISADGTTVVGNIGRAFRWTEANGMQYLGWPPGTYEASAWGVSADGHVIVGYYAGANYAGAFRWTEATGMVGLGSLPDGASWPNDVSEDGLVVVGRSGGQAFIWSEVEGMRGIGSGSAQGVSGDGTVVGQNDSGAFIWDANHGMQNLKNVLENAYGLDINGWRLGYCSDISADGRTIVGTGNDPNGHMQAWMAIIEGPTPSVKLTVQVEPNDLGIDTITPSVGEHIYYKNWPVVIKADPFKNCPDVYRFSHWVGDVAEPNSATMTLVMAEDKTFTAVYNIDQRRCGDECHPILQGDLNKDCYTNFEDFALYCENWLSCTHPDCD